MKKTFGDRLKELRGDLSQSAFSLKLGVKQTTYSAWERGHMEPSASAITCICRQTGKSSDWLLGIDETRGHITATNSAISIGGNATLRDCTQCELMKAAAKVLKKK